MKRKLVVAGTGVLAVALLGIGGWYVAHTKATEAELSRAVAAYESRTPVPVNFVVSVPANTPKDQVLYVSGSVPALGNWDAAGVPLTRTDDGKYAATVPDLLNGLEYKFKVTRGTWGTAEATPDGKESDDHTFTAAKDARVEVAIPNWMDGGKAVPGRVTLTGNVIVHKNALKSKLLGNARTLIVYLPPDYEKNKEQRYPTIYFQDGQNIFDEATSYQGIEWRLDEAAQKLITERRIKPAILVGVFNSGEQRAAEFTPPFAAGTVKEQPKGDAYARMLVEEAKPFIDNAYRTAPDRQNTMIGGGSMGALIALYTAKQHNNVFGQVIALSPWLRIGEKGDKPLVDELVGDGAWLKNTRLYVDMGTSPGHNYPGDPAQAIPDAQQLVAAVEKAGVPQGEQFIYREIEGGTHNEAAWQATAEQVLLAVLGTSQAQPATAPATQNVAVK